MDEKMSRLHLNTPATYRISVQGAIDRKWSEYLDDMAISLRQVADETPTTVLTGRLVDQAALMGVLNNVYDLGYPLLSVARVDQE